jgi:hypothetical protein
MVECEIFVDSFSDALDPFLKVADSFPKAVDSVLKAAGSFLKGIDSVPKLIDSRFMPLIYLLMTSIRLLMLPICL